MSKRKSKTWSCSVGRYGFRIRVYEDAYSGILQAEMRDPLRPGKYRCTSLRHRDRPKAIAWARDQVEKWMAGELAAEDRTPTLSHVFPAYRRFQTPSKVASEQKADERRIVMWMRVLGASKDLSKLTLQEWQGFIAVRRSGAIDSTGAAVAEVAKRRPVRDSTVEADLTFLLSVLNWATRWREGDRYLMSENPARGYPLPKEKNPRRPVVTTDRFDKVRAVADCVTTFRLVTMPDRASKKRVVFRSYLPEILDLLWWSGRRVSAILALRYEDLRLNEGPCGRIRFPAATDKRRVERVVDLAPAARAAIDRILANRPGIGAAYLFPAPNGSGSHVAKEVVAQWLRAAETLAKVEKHNGSLFHAYRRGWATARKSYPIADVMAAGGWNDPYTLTMIYQRPDHDTMYKVVSEPAELRNAVGQ